MPHEPYQTADRAIDLLNRKAIRRFQQAKSECSLARFDELNVIQIVKGLYHALARDDQTAFLDVARTVYRDVAPDGTQEPDLSWLLAMLDEYDPVTKYVYSHELMRKREYATEGIIASEEKSKEFKKALSRWAQFTAYYADKTEWEATVKGFKDTGVKKVRWMTEEDDRVCEICGPRHRKVYPIDDIPPKEHWGCRCWLEPADRNDQK